MTSERAPPIYPGRPGRPEQPGRRHRGGRCGSIRPLLQTVGITPASITGPAPAPLHRVRTRYHWQLLIYEADTCWLHQHLRTATQMFARTPLARKVQLDLKVDPTTLAQTPPRPPGAPMPPPRRYTHWITLDPSRRNAARITATLARGSRFRVERVHLHPTRGDLYILAVSAAVPYRDLDFDLNSLTSPPYHLSRRPMGLGPGLSLESFETIFGPIIPRTVWATPALSPSPDPGPPRQANTEES